MENKIILSKKVYEIKELKERLSKYRKYLIKKNKLEFKANSKSKGIIKEELSKKEQLNYFLNCEFYGYEFEYPTYERNRFEDPHLLFNESLKSLEEKETVEYFKEEKVYIIHLKQQNARYYGNISFSEGENLYCLSGRPVPDEEVMNYYSKDDMLYSGGNWGPFFCNSNLFNKFTLLYDRVKDLKIEDLEKIEELRKDLKLEVKNEQAAKEITSDLKEYIYSPIIHFAYIGLYNYLDTFFLSFAEKASNEISDRFFKRAEEIVAYKNWKEKNQFTAEYEEIVLNNDLYSTLSSYREDLNNAIIWSQKNGLKNWSEESRNEWLPRVQEILESVEYKNWKLENSSNLTNEKEDLVKYFKPLSKSRALSKVLFKTLGYKAYDQKIKDKKDSSIKIEESLLNFFTSKFGEAANRLVELQKNVNYLDRRLNIDVAEDGWIYTYDNTNYPWLENIPKNGPKDICWPNQTYIYEILLPIVDYQEELEGCGLFKKIENETLGPIEFELLDKKKLEIYNKIIFDQIYKKVFKEYIIYQLENVDFQKPYCRKCDEKKLKKIKDLIEKDLIEIVIRFDLSRVKKDEK